MNESRGIENPIFIVGTERSGSNLLRLLLNELPEVTVPHPPHLMRDLSPLVPGYGDLNIDRNFSQLITDAIKLVDLHFAPWPIRIDGEEILTTASERDLYSVYLGIYEQCRRWSGKLRWACKSTFMIHHVEKILSRHKSPQFIHLVRDVRDVAVSARKSVFCHYHPYYVARLWKREQDIAAAWANKLPPETWLTVNYEDLIKSPALEMRRICAFLGATYSDDLLNFFEKGAARELSHLSRSWQNVGKPVLKENSRKFLTELKPEDQRLIQSVLNDDEEPKPIQLLKYYALENLMMWNEEARSLFKDRNAKFRLRKKAYLWSISFFR